MGLPFAKKKPKDAGEKKDLKQNYTTEDHKTDLGDLLRSFDSDASQGMRKAAVEERIATEGKNQLTPPEETPW